MRRKIPIPAKCSGSRCASLNSTSSLFYLSVHVLLLYCDVLMFSFADLPLIFFSSLYCFLFVLLQSSLLFIIECTLGLRQKYFCEICLQFTVWNAIFSHKNWKWVFALIFAKHTFWPISRIASEEKGLLQYMQLGNLLRVLGPIVKELGSQIGLLQPQCCLMMVNHPQPDKHTRTFNPTKPY